MKKIIKATFLLGSILMIAGCGPQQSSQPANSQPTDNQSTNNQPVSNQSNKSDNSNVASTKETSNQEAQVSPDEQPTFASDAQGNYYGKLTITGYPIIKNTPEPFCEENCKTYQYVYFQILNTNSNALFNFLGINEGNNFVGEKQVGLGCEKNKIISYYNDSDKFGMKEYSVSSQASSKILGASKENPVTIKLERLLFTSGSGAPACYSHFTYVDYLK